MSTRLRRFGLVLASVLALGILKPSAAQADAPTTIILTRHAEKAAGTSNDLALSAAGEQRAKDLWTALKDAGVRAVITSQYVRTKATAAPTAAALGLTPDPISTEKPQHVADVVAAIHQHAGQTVLVVGHSDTVPDIIAALKAPKPPAICEKEYDNLYIVTIAADGKASVVHARYGAPTPVGPGCAAMR